MRIYEKELLVAYVVDYIRRVEAKCPDLVVCHDDSGRPLFSADTICYMVAACVDGFTNLMRQIHEITEA